MSNEPTLEKEGTPTTGQVGNEPTQGKEEKTFTQEELNKIVQERIGAEKDKYKDYDEIKSKLQGLEDANKSELEKLTEKLAAAESKAKDLETAAQVATWRVEVRKEKGIPETMDALLTGTTQEEIKAQADIIVTNITKGAGKPVIQSDKGDNTQKTAVSSWAETAKQLTGG